MSIKIQKDEITTRGPKMRKLENLLTNQDKYINNRYILFAEAVHIIVTGGALSRWPY